MSEQEDDPVWSDLKCDAFIKSVGYKSVRIPGLPWDEKKNTIPHSYGCIQDPVTEQLLIGLYCAGWVKRGPVGIIDATLRDSLETFKQLKFHLEAGLLPARSTTVDEVKALFDNQEKLVTTDGWSKIKSEEIRRGQELNKIKEKVLEKDEMISIAHSN